MRLKQKNQAAAFYLFSVLSASHATAVSALDGKALYEQKLCHTCHGTEGNKPIAPNYPKLGGQSAVYLAEQSKLIRDGKRNSGLSIAMKGMVATVKDEELQAISEYLAGIGGK